MLYDSVKFKCLVSVILQYLWWHWIFNLLILPISWMHNLTHLIIFWCQNKFRNVNLSKHFDRPQTRIYFWFISTTFYVNRRDTHSHVVINFLRTSQMKYFSLRPRLSIKDLTPYHRVIKNYFNQCKCITLYRKIQTKISQNYVDLYYHKYKYTYYLLHFTKTVLKWLNISDMPFLLLVIVLSWLMHQNLQYVFSKKSSLKPKIHLFVHAA